MGKGPKRRLESQPDTCTVEGCGKPTVARGWCAAHYRRWRRKGEPGPALVRFAGQGKCRVEGCEHVGALKAGMCAAHHHRQLRYGDPRVQMRPGNGATEEWVRAHATFSGDDCLFWPFGRSTAGYGVATSDGRRIGAARLMCEVAHGPPPTPDHEAAHSCGKGHEGCVSPRHLRWATPIENQADKVEHGTSYRGERHWQNKLSEGDVRKIRRLIGVEPQSKIATMFGINQCTVSEIKTGRKWGWLK